MSGMYSQSEEPATEAAWVYIVRCSDDTLYTGYTLDLERRLKAHNEGHGAKYTRSRRPVSYVYTEKCESRIHAMQREYQVKKLTRSQKMKLIASCPE